MQRQRPLTLLVMGLGCCAFAVLHVCWLLLYRRADLAALVAAALGNSDAVAGLQGRGLARAAVARLAAPHLLVDLALPAPRAGTGAGLVGRGPPARWPPVC